MRDKHAKDGLAVITVSLDEDAQTKEGQDKVRKLLESKKATQFTNLILDEKLEFWQQKLKFDGPACSPAGCSNAPLIRRSLAWPSGKAERSPPGCRKAPGLS